MYHTLAVHVLASCIYCIGVHYHFLWLKLKIEPWLTCWRMCPSPVGAAQVPTVCSWDDTLLKSLQQIILLQHQSAFLSARFGKSNVQAEQSTPPVVLPLYKCYNVAAVRMEVSTFWNVCQSMILLLFCNKFLAKYFVIKCLVRSMNCLQTVCKEYLLLMSSDLQTLAIRLHTWAATYLQSLIKGFFLCFWLSVCPELVLQDQTVIFLLKDAGCFLHFWTLLCEYNSQQKT